MLYQRLGRPALSKTLYLVGQRPVAEEIVQNVFVKLWQEKKVFPTLRHAYAWVYKCCTNGAIDVLRSKGRQALSLDQAGDLPDQRLSAEERATVHQIWTALSDSFDPREAELFVYRMIEGLSQEEVVEVMGISRRTVNRIQSSIDEKIAKLRAGRYAG